MEWMTDYLTGDYSAASQCWQGLMEIVWAILGLSPQEFNAGGWNLVVGTLYPYFVGIGAVLLNLFFLIGFCRTVSNLKEGITFEYAVEMMIKAVIANLLLTYGLDIMNDFISLSGAITKTLLPASTYYRFSINGDVGFGTGLVSILMSPLLLILVLVCGVMILMEVLGRYLSLFELIIVAPVAMSTVAGGRGVSNTAVAWVKSFFTNVFQIIIIGIVLRLGSTFMGATSIIEKMIGAEDFVAGGFGALLKPMIFIPFIAASVKASDNFLKRAFDLR